MISYKLYVVSVEMMKKIYFQLILREVSSIFVILLFKLKSIHFANLFRLPQRSAPLLLRVG